MGAGITVTPQLSQAAFVFGNSRPREDSYITLRKAELARLIRAHDSHPEHPPKYLQCFNCDIRCS
jgi:hypothetical protein